MLAGWIAVTCPCSLNWVTNDFLSHVETSFSCQEVEGFCSFKIINEKYDTFVWQTNGTQK